MRAGAEKTGEKECVGFSGDLGKEKVLRIELSGIQLTRRLFTLDKPQRPALGELRSGLVSPLASVSTVRCLLLECRNWYQ